MSVTQHVCQMKGLKFLTVKSNKHGSTKEQHMFDLMDLNTSNIAQSEVVMWLWERFGNHVCYAERGKAAQCF